MGLRWQISCEPNPKCLQKQKRCLSELAQPTLWSTQPWSFPLLDTAPTVLNGRHVTNGSKWQVQAWTMEITELQRKQWVERQTVCARTLQSSRSREYRSVPRGWPLADTTTCRSRLKSENCQFWTRTCWSRSSTVEIATFAPCLYVAMQNDSSYMIYDIYDIYIIFPEKLLVIHNYSSWLLQSCHHMS